MKTLVLLDTHALIHRAYHALPKFTSSRTGEPTGALYGLVSMLLRVARELKPDYIAAAYDLPEPTFRHKEYKEYKATRREAEDELKAQLERSKDIVKAFGIPIYSAPGYEADDVLGTIAAQLKKEKGIKIVIVSGDMDALQLVDGDRVVVYTLRRGLEDTVTYNEKKVIERFGFLPSLLPDFKGLKGDPSDNIKGVPGIGDKTASDIIKNFGSLENLYKNFPPKADQLNTGKIKKFKNLKERTVKILLEHKKDAEFSKKLATIRTDVPIRFDLAESVFVLKPEALKNLLLELGFKSLLSRLEGQSTLFGEAAPEAPAGPAPAASCVAKAVKDVKERFWTDIYGLSEVFLLSSGNGNFYVKGVKNIWIFDAKFLKDNAARWNKLFGEKALVTHAAKELLKTFWDLGIKAENIFDLALAAWVAESVLKTPSTEDIYFHFFKKNYAGRREESVNILPELYAVISSELKKRNTEKVFYDLETPLMFILARMEERGIKSDVNFLKKFGAELKEKILALEKKIYALAGAEFNLNSPSQVAGALFEKLKITPPAGASLKKTKGGKISTREEELQKMKDSHPIVPLILEHREVSKLLNTYALPLAELSQKDGRIHTTYNQTGTVTGRLSSEAPNLQNIPIRAELGAKIRNGFVASPGFTLAAFDYAQIELKILAAFAKDTGMLEAFHRGIDIHKFTAAKINNVSSEKVTAQMRGRAKAINFGIVYGMGIRQLAQSAGMSAKEAAAFYDEYFKDFPEIRAYLESVKKEVKKKGYVETLFGRKRYFDLGGIQDGFREAEMERMAVNAVIQGTDADIVKKAMVDVDKWAKNKNFGVGVYPLLQIHDEVIYEIRDDIIKEVVPKIKSIMESAVEFPVPLSVEAKTGKKLSELRHFQI